MEDILVISCGIAAIFCLIRIIHQYRKISNKKYFTCAMYGYVGERGPEEEALAELKEEFGDIDPKDCAIVCDDCWEKVRPRNNPEMFEAWKKEKRNAL